MIKRKITIGICAVILTCFAAVAYGQDPVHFRGTIQKLGADNIVINQISGDTITIMAPKEMIVLTSEPTAAANIVAEKFIGVTALALPDGSLKALEVHIFSEAGRGIGEGHYPWSLLPESTMTNANISSMVESVDGAVMSLAYKDDGSQKVVIPPGVPVVKLELVNNWSPMEVGSHIFVVASEGDDGQFSAIAVVIGLRGTTPPM